MGLSQCEDSRVSATSLWLVAALCGLALLIQLAGDGAQSALRFARQSIGAGELWRLFSGHLVHLGWTHLLLNLAGLALVWALVGSVYSGLVWILVTFAVVFAVDAGLWLLNPGLEWYVGLSGVLHGLLVAGLIGLISAGTSRRNEAIALLVLLLLKLGYEQTAGAMPGSTSLAGGAVVVDAHLYGAVGGLCAALVVFLVSRRPHIH